MRWLALVLMLVSGPLGAADLSALARVQPGSQIVDDGAALSLSLELSHPVPFAVHYLADPPRAILDFNEVDWGRGAEALDRSDRVVALGAGPLRPGWSRLVIQLDRPMLLQSAEMLRRPDQGARLVARFAPASAEDFAARTGVPDQPAPTPVASAPAPATGEGDGRLRVLIDPGHGGIDPGAEVEGHVEADLMLGFARELKEALLRDGTFEVFVTRNDDRFVPLESRVSMAHRIGADVLLSLHADVVLEGEAQGLTLYTLSDEASDIASRKLAERHDQADLLAGVDLSGQGDEIALVLMDIARVETAHRTERLVDALITALDGKVTLYKKPHLTAGFSVLKAPDVPSVLIELGFMSSARDLANLQDPAWRQNAIEGLRLGLRAWALTDAAERSLRRR